MSKKQSRKGGNNRKNNKSKSKQSSITSNNNNKQNRNKRNNNNGNNKQIETTQARNNLDRIESMIEELNPKIDLDIPSAFDNQCYVIIILLHFIIVILIIPYPCTISILFFDLFINKQNRFIV